MWAGQAAMRKSIPALRQAGYEIISDLPRIQKSYREEALVVTPPVMRICATSNGEQRVQVLILVVQGLSQKQRQLMQQYFELVDWQGLKMMSAERRQRDSVKSFNAQSKCGKTGYVLRMNSQHSVKICLQQNRYQPSARNRVQIQQRGTQAERIFGQRALAGGNMWVSLSCLLKLLESCDKNNPDSGMGTDSVARQMRQKTVQHTGST